MDLTWNEEEAKNPYLMVSYEQGFREGFAEGWLRSKAESVRLLRRNLNLSPEAAMNALDISPEEQRKLAPLI